MTQITYLAVWRGDECEFIQSEVEIGINDPHQMTNNDWVVAAALSEDYSPEDAQALIEQGYELILVCPMPTAFFNT
jgi:hypothetical protein